MARGSKDKVAERLFHKWLIHSGYPKDNISKAVSSRFNREDILGCDLVIYHDGKFWGVQVTTASGVTARKRRLENFGFKTTRKFRISIATHEPVRDPANRTRKLHYWRIQDYLGDEQWAEPVAEGPWDRKEIEAVSLR